MFDNIFDNIKYTNINWGNFGNAKEIIVDQYNNDNNFKLEKQQDTYRTLKNVAFKNNDKPQAIKFFAKEMENAYKLENWSNFSNKFTLFFNKVTNNFGLSWVRPIFILIGLTAFFYWWILSICNMNFIHNYQYIIDFANPIKYLDWITGFYAKLVYILFKILQGLLIYQIIVAFRKYSK